MREFLETHLHRFKTCLSENSLSARSHSMVVSSCRTVFAGIRKLRSNQSCGVDHSSAEAQDSCSDRVLDHSELRESIVRATKCVSAGVVIEGRAQGDIGN